MLCFRFVACGVTTWRSRDAENRLFRRCFANPAAKGWAGRLVLPGRNQRYSGAIFRQYRP